MINSFDDGTRSWVMIVNGINKIRNGDVGRDSHRGHWREYAENRCEGKTETDAKFDAIFYDDSSAVS